MPNKICWGCWLHKVMAVASTGKKQVNAEVPKTWAMFFGQQGPPMVVVKRQKEWLSIWKRAVMSHLFQTVEKKWSKPLGNKKFLKPIVSNCGRILSKNGHQAVGVARVEDEYYCFFQGAIHVKWHEKCTSWHPQVVQRMDFTCFGLEKWLNVNYQRRDKQSWQPLTRGNWHQGVTALPSAHRDPGDIFLCEKAQLGH